MKQLCLILSLAAAVAGCAHTPGQSPSGREIVRRDCGGCHAYGERDQSRMPAAPPLRTLGARYEVESLAEALAEGISVGHPMMPEYSYPPEEIDKLIAYLKSIQALRPNADPGETE